MVGSQISFISLWSPSLLVYSYLTACPLPGPCVLHLWALRTWGLATCPIPRVLFSAGEGKRCWTLPRCAYVLEKGRGLSSRENQDCLLTAASPGGETGLGSKGGQHGPREWTLGDSHPLFPLTKCPGDPWLRPAQGLAQWQGKGAPQSTSKSFDCPHLPHPLTFLHFPGCPCPPSQEAELGGFSYAIFYTVLH